MQMSLKCTFKQILSGRGKILVAELLPSTQQQHRGNSDTHPPADQQLLQHLSCDRGHIIPISSVINLIGKFDPALSYNTHISHICKIAFFHLKEHFPPKTLSPFLIKKSLSMHLLSLELIMWTQYLGACLQIQLINYSSSKTMLENKKVYPHLPHPCWPPLAVPHWIAFQIHFVVYKALNSTVPAYLSDLLSPYKPPCTLRSGHAKLLHTNRTWLCTMGFCAFSSQAPCLWRSNPDSLRAAQSYWGF